MLLFGVYFKREAPMPVNRNDNAVLFWNGVLLEAMEDDSQRPPANQDQGGPTRASRAAAIVHAAIHNAINGVLQRNTFYQDPTTMAPAPPGPPPAGASQQAAGAGAAHRALVALYPAQAATFNQARADFDALALPGVPHPPSFAFGEGVAQQLLDTRANDGSVPPGPYMPPTPGPGVWVEDANLAPPVPPLTHHWGTVRLFLLDAISRVRPPGFIALSSGDYAFAFRNVRDKGRDPSPPPPPPQGRTADEENIALFWAYDDQLGTPIRLYNRHAFEILNQEPNVPANVSVIHRHARMFALINLTMADAGIACWEAKFRPPPDYHIWRPFQGIRGAANDGNPETAPIANWLPLGRPQAPVNNATPNFPAYPSGHSSFGTASFGMLRKFFGTKPFPFVLSSEEVPNNRSYADTTNPQTGAQITSWTQAINENEESRIFLGVHWRTDAIQGRPLGQKVSDYIWDRYLRPIN
jgi:hypothetical protein